MGMSVKKNFFVGD